MQERGEVEGEEGRGGVKQVKFDVKKHGVKKKLLFE